MSDYIQIRHLARSLLLSRWPESVWVCMAISNHHTGYFDDSHVEHRYPIVAGFWAAIEVWEFVEKELKRELSKKSNRLKAKKYLQANPIRFAKIFDKYNLQPIYAGIEKSLINCLTDRDKIKYPLHDSSYTNCAYMCCELLDKQAEDIKIRHPIKVIFDSGSAGKNLFERGYRKYYKEKKPTYLEPSVGFDNEEVVLPLLTAHLYAWLIGKWRNSDHQDHEINKALLAIHKNNQPRGIIVTEAAIRRIMSI